MTVSNGLSVSRREKRPVDKLLVCWNWMHWTGFFRTAFSGVRKRAILNPSTSSLAPHRPLKVRSLERGVAHACAVRRPLNGVDGGSGSGGDDYALRIWYLASLNKKMLSEMVAFCYIQKLKHTISQEKKYQLHLKTENRNRTN